MYPMALYVIIQNVVVAAGMVVAGLFFPHVLSEATTSVSAWSDLYVTFLTVSAVISTVLFGMLYRKDIRTREYQFLGDRLFICKLECKRFVRHDFFLFYMNDISAWF